MTVPQTSVPPPIGTTILGVGPIGTDALRTDASMVPIGTHIAPPSPYNDASTATVPAVPSVPEDVEMENQSSGLDGTS
eukprot:183079-Amphidinium_carterae.1